MNHISTARKLYYEREHDGSYSLNLSEPYNITPFNTWAEMVAFCVRAFGQDIEFYEVTPENWQQLYDSGAFDEAPCPD